MKTITTKEVAKALLRHVFQYHLLSKEIIFDRDL